MESLRRIRMQRRPLQTGIRESVLEAVLSGTVKPGQKIAVQPLADLLGVSITPVREALSALISEGVLDMLPGGSAVVPQVTGSVLQQWLWLRRDIEMRLVEMGLQKKSSADTAAIIATAERGGGAEAIADACTAIIDRLITLAHQQVLLDNLRRVRNRCGAPLVEATRRVAVDHGAHFLRDVKTALASGSDSAVSATYARYQDRIDTAALSHADTTAGRR